MKNIFRALVLLGLFGGSALAASSNYWFSLPLIVVTPRSMDFGSVPIGTTVTNKFVVENSGSGRLAGTASVSAPFKIISGGEYSLKHGSAQVVKIIYTPSGAMTDQAVVKFTGEGGGAKATVTGKAAPARPNQPPPPAR